MHKRFISVLSGVCAAALICMIIILSITGKPVREPFVPPAFEVSVQRGVPDVPEALDWQSLDAPAFSVGICGVFLPQENAVDLWLSNPQTNDVWLKVRVLDDSGQILGETGLIRPGEYVQSVMIRSVPPVGTPVTLKVMAYERETYYSAGAVSLTTVVAGA